MKLISTNEWEKIEQALMQAEIPYKVNFDSHSLSDCKEVIYNKIISIDTFAIRNFYSKNEEEID